MKNNQGIAIVAAIVVMVVIMALGAGSMFLTQNNLKTAENVRSNTTAKSNAESGLDAAYVLLNDYYLEHQSEGFPGDFTFQDTDTYTLTYEQYSDERVRIESTGISASGAEYKSEAIFAIELGDSSIPPELIRGLVSEGEVRVNGGASLYVDAGVHGNSGFWLGGNFQVCQSRDSNGLCVAFDPATLADEDLPVSTSSSTGTCRVRNRSCNPANYMASAVDIGVNYLYRRNRAADLNGDDSFDTTNYRTSADCTGALSAPSGNTMASRVICSNTAVNFNNARLTDVTIITTGAINLTGTCILNNVTLISLTNSITMGSCTSTNVRIFSQNSLTFSGSNNNARSWTWNGENTIATAGNITFNGSNRHDNTVNPIYNEDGSVAIGLALIAGGSMTFNGSNTSRNYYATFVSGGSFTQNGTSRFFGSIASETNLRFNGNLEIDSGLGYQNRDLESEADPYLAASSRR